MIEIYVPVLLNFRDNALVYLPEQVERLRDTLLSEDNGIRELEAADAVFGHELVRPDATALESGDVPAWPEQLDRVEAYYYHHRIILRYLFSQAPKGGDRAARQVAVAHSAHVLEHHFVHRINTVDDGAPLPDDEHGRVTSYYSYCLIFAPEPAHFQDRMDNLLGSHTFRIVEVTPRLLERDRTHLVRISIPSTNVYSTTDVGRWLKVDILNAVYQHMLYAKKEQDERDLQTLVAFSRRATAHRNVMEESQLHALWDHAVDALGGRTVDLHSVSQQTNLFRISFVAVVLAALSSVVAVVSLIVVLR
ncbi:hypothetical protein [Nocardioides cynanchi]|uniref:hypothetical protein n=1 Tax=Nocardioides cynanchi TaxID=2558918 RepID=UPI001247EFB9|nr:hypothetical protein [Nocardioides cynanchi]